MNKSNKIITYNKNKAIQNVHNTKQKLLYKNFTHICIIHEINEFESMKYNEFVMST